MSLPGKVDLVATERRRILEEYRRRERSLDPNLYAPWQPGEEFLRAGRRRRAASMLKRAGVFPRAGDPCLEVGYGSLGWLGDLLCWGLKETDLHGIELDPARAARARETLPAADLRVGDATALPWESDTFQLVVVSTVFSSILDSRVRRALAQEILRVLAAGGALLFYDFAVNNPRNREVRRVGRAEVRELWKGLEGQVRTATLAPPLARWLAPRSFLAATLLEAIPFLRTHLIAVLMKRG
ncbi:MAG: class I SAM-dependent methyltransferase [Thermoanaerobaculia bacterium]